MAPPGLPRVGRASLGFAALSLALLTASALPAQTLTGHVIEVGSGQPVAGAEARLIDGTTSVVIVRSLSHAEGRFVLEAPVPGTYELELERFGYRTYGPERLELGEEEIRTLEIELEPAAIPLEELTVTSRLRRIRHEPTYEGLYARHATSPSIGNNRVILRTDPEFDVAMSVRDLLYNFRPASCRPYVFWNGFLVRDSELARELLEVSASNVEGVEYYRDFANMPLSYRSELSSGLRHPVPPSAIRRCGVISIWPRRF